MDKFIYNERDNNVGLKLCTSGRRDVLINGRLFHIYKGMLCFFSPIISIYELSRSDDYGETAISDNALVFYPIAKSLFNMILRFRIFNSPWLQLDSRQYNFFMEQADRINRKKAYLDTLSDGDERKLVKLIIQNIEQETFLEFLYLFFTGTPVEPAQVKRSTAIAFNFIFAASTHCNEQRSVKFYADEANLSVSHFTRIVKSETGSTPSEWIANMTMVNAKMLLKQADISIKEVAAKMNFPEQFTFRKYFKQHEGISPSEYRNRVTKKEQG